MASYPDERNALIAGRSDNRTTGNPQHRALQYVTIGFLIAILGSVVVASNNPSVLRNGQFDSHSRDLKEKECEKGDYRKRTLQLAHEISMVALFKDMKGQRKHEASGIIKVDDTVYAVCDSSWAIAKFSDTLEPFGSQNVLVGDPEREGDDSGYEAIFHEAGVFYVIRESIEMEQHEYHAIIEELDIQGDDYVIKDQCPCELEFEGDSKGFEGAIAVRNLDFQLIILALCEGNHCSERRKDDKGNGRLVAMQKVQLDDGTCQWATVRTINIPPSADFTDYSAISMDEEGRVAISSQEDSQLWIGKLNGKTSSGVWDIAAIEFEADESKVYDFPKNDQCETVYCNIEGIHWVNEDMIIAASDKMKKKQDFRCFSKDQSVHTFVLP